MNYIKLSVSLLGIKPEMVIGYIVVQSVYAKFGLDCVVTSVTDGQHKVVNSLHYTGNAMDFRTTELSMSYDWDSVRAKVKQCLGKDFDVILEKDHLHVEYQP